MLGYWLAATAMSTTLGLVTVFALEGSGVVKTATKKTLSRVSELGLARPAR